MTSVSLENLKNKAESLMYQEDPRVIDTSAYLLLSLFRLQGRDKAAGWSTWSPLVTTVILGVLAQALVFLLNADPK